MGAKRITIQCRDGADAEPVELHADNEGYVRAFDKNGTWLGTFNEETSYANWNTGVEPGRLTDAINEGLDAELDKPWWKRW